MNKRLAVGLYLLLWFAIVAAIVSGLIRVGVPFPLSALFGTMLFIVLNGTLAYRHRARQLAQEGRPPPSYIKYLLVPQGFGREIRVPRLIRMLLALIVAAGSALFLFVALAMAKQLASSEVPHLTKSLIGLILVALLGASFAYVAVRLLVAKEGESLFKVPGFAGGRRRDGA